MIEVLKQALEALETEVSIDWTNNDEFNASAEKMHDAIASLRQAIAELEREKEIHDRHCNQGEWKGVCKYSDSNCPTIAELESQEPVAYPEGDVVGPCICGSWPGGKCLKCPRITPPQRTEQEPVSTLWQHGETGRFRVTTPDSITDCDAQWFKVGDLYTHPPQRTEEKNT